MSSVYLSGPLANCTEGEARGWRLVAKSLLPDFECVDPSDNWFQGDYSELGVEGQAALVDSDLAGIERSSVVLCSPWKKSFGTPMELVYATFWRKPVVLVWPKLDLSPWLRFHSTVVVPTVEQGCEWIRKNVK